MSTLHISLQQMRNFSWMSVASEYMIPLWPLPFDSTVTFIFLTKKKCSSTCQYNRFALPCVLGRQITPWNGLLLTPGHLLWGWRTLKTLGLVGGEGGKMILKDELTRYKAKLSGLHFPWWGWKVSCISQQTVFWWMFLSFHTGILMGSLFKGK